MANPEHLEILKQGVEAWNRWIEDNPKIEPDLSTADLTNLDLDYANLSGTNLSEANLAEMEINGANLTDATLIRANLTSTAMWGAKLARSILIGACLHKADLMGAYLGGADLTDADLSNADLTFATLSLSKISGANFSQAVFGGTTFGEIDLSGAKGLDTAGHIRPSTVGVDTIYLSKGLIPETFLRGCGIPDKFITYARSLVGAAIDFYSCFISYSSKNQAFAECIYADLQDKGVRCWFAPEDLKIGDKFRQRIDESIKHHDKLLLILSEQSITSAWVEEEVESAFEREHKENRLVLFPIRIDDAVIDSEQAWAASLRRMRHIGDFSKWKEHDSYQKAFARLMRDLKVEVSK